MDWIWFSIGSGLADYKELQTACIPAECLLPDGGSVEIKWYNQSVGYSCFAAVCASGNLGGELSSETKC